jgi:hypothetical protein
VANEQTEPDQQAPEDLVGYIYTNTVVKVVSRYLKENLIFC